MSLTLSNTAFKTAAPPREGFALAEKLAILKRHRKLMMMVTALTFSTALLWQALTPSLKPAQAKIVFTPQNMNLETGIALVDSQMKVMLSSALLAKVITNENLIRDAEFGGKGSTGFLRVLGNAVGILNDGTPEQKALRALEKNVTLQRVDKTLMVDVIVQTSDPQKSLRLADALIETFVENIATSQLDGSRRNGTALSSRLEEVKREVKRAEDKLERFKLNNSMAGGGKLISEKQFDEVSNQLVAARKKTAELRSRLEQVQKYERNGSDMTALSEVMQSPAIANLKTQFTELTRQEADLLTTLGVRHPQVISVQKQLTDVKKVMVDEMRRVVKSLNSDYERAMGVEKTLAQTLEELRQDQSSSSGSYGQLRDMEREVEAAKGLYLSMAGRAGAMNESDKLDLNSVRVLSAATLTASKTLSSGLFLSFSLLLGLGLGMGFAFYRDATSDVIYGAGSLTKITGLPVFLPQNIANNASKQAVVLFEIEGCKRTKTVMELALQAASQGQRVLVIDADLSTKALTGQTGGKTAGIADIAQGRGELTDFILHDTKTGLYLLPASATNGENVTQITQALADKLLKSTGLFNLVLIDGGVLTENSAAFPFLRKCDTAYLVVEAGLSTQKDVLHSLKLLREQVSKLTGIVFNH